MRKLITLILIIILLDGCKKEAPTQSQDQNVSPPFDVLYVGGKFTITGNVRVNNIAMWDGTNWLSVGTGVGGVSYSDVECMTVYKSELYVGGFIDSAGAVKASNIAKWNGIAWSSVGGGLDGRVTSLVVYNNELYAGGSFQNAGGVKASNIAKWNGTTWSPVGEGLNDEVYALAVYNGSLYAGGWFAKNIVGNFPADHIAKWDGGKWNSIISQIGGSLPQGTWVSSLSVFNNDLYVGGSFETCNGIRTNSIAKWNDTSWFPVGEGVKPWPIVATIEYQSELNVVGGFTVAGTDTTPYCARWNGTKWLPRNFAPDSNPYCLFVFKDKLYVGGGFKSVNNTSINGVFEWNGNDVRSLESGIQGSVLSMAVYKNRQ